MHKLMIGLLLLGIAPLAACRAYVLSPGANGVDREYPRPAVEAYAAARRSAEAAGFHVTSDKHDTLGGDLMASRNDGTTLRIHVKGMSKKRSRVTVRVEPADPSLANSMQDRVAGNLEPETEKDSRNSTLRSPVVGN